MATEYKKISQLPAAESLRGTDQLEIERDGTSKSITASLIKDYTNDGLIDDAHSGSQSTYSSGLIDQKLDLKQNATDNRLNTVSKTIVGAINEIFSGGGGGYPVLYGTTDPTSAQGSDGQLYAKYETVNNVTSVIAMWLKIQSDWCSIVMSSGGDVGIECTQAQYDAWEQAGTLLEDTNYYITDGQSGGGVVIDDTTASTTTVYSSDKVEDLLGDKQDTLSFHSANSSSAISINGTYQIPANVLAHTFIVIACRRGGLGNSAMFKTDELLTFDNGFTFLATGGGYCTLKCSNTGLLTVTNIVNMSEPYILVTGLL